MATLSVQDIVEAGIAHTTASAGGSGDVFTNPSDERTFLLVTNGSGGSINVTIAKQQASVNVPGFGALSLSDNVVAVAAGATKLIGPFPQHKYNNASGQVAVTYSSATSVTVAAIRLARAA